MAWLQWHFLPFQRNHAAERGGFKNAFQIGGLKWQDYWEPLFQGQISCLKSLHLAFFSVPSAQYFVPTDAHLSTSRDR